MLASHKGVLHLGKLFHGLNDLKRPNILSRIGCFVTASRNTIQPFLTPSFIHNKSRLGETPTLSACADSSTNTTISRLFDTFLHFYALFSHFFPFFALFVTFLAHFIKTKS